MASEGIPIEGASEMLKKLVTVVDSLISLDRGVEDELVRLKQILEVISAQISDAERNQMNDASVSLWLKRLKEVSYDAEDVLDELYYEALRRSNKITKVKVCFSSSNQVVLRFKRDRKIKGVNMKFNQIATDMRRFQFQITSSTNSGRCGQPNNHNLLPISFLANVSKLVGRKEDKSKIVRMLTTTGISSSTSFHSSYVDCDTNEKVSVISIVGIGGLGKTSLAQSIYSDKLVENHFVKKMWFCVSDAFDVFEILRNILESITGCRCQDFSNTDLLVQKVRENLQGKKYLLVLDDLWNEDPTEWDKLKSVLDFGSFGSKVIVTTRCQKVASVVQGLIPPYNLDLLSEAECWSIIKNKAFFLGGASETPSMEIIGKQISRKCGGLPLAANFFGFLMHSHRNASNWMSLRDNKSLETLGNYPNAIIPILKLSYDTLPSHLKQCFSYCGLFPRNWRYNRETLIRLWMAEGFLYPSNGGNQNSLENIGNDYFLSLLHSQFFQVVEWDADFGDIVTFEMHNLVHELASSVVDSHAVTVWSTREMKNDMSQVHRLQVIIEGITRKEIDERKPRTVFLQEDGVFYPSLLNNKRLRVIHRLVGAGRSLKTISPTFKFGKQMRYLDLSYSDLKDVHSDSIHQLYNLQTLNLCYSKNVQTIFKEGIGGLINLRHLNLSGCKLISVFPTDIGNLQNLSSLDISDTDISELPDSISLLYNLTKFNFKACSKLETLPRDFEALTHLKCLDLSGTRIKELHESILNGLCNLETLNLGHCKLPQEVGHLKCLKHFIFEGDKFETPRGIRKLTFLQTLQQFVVREDNESDGGGIGDLEDLNLLKGKIKICKLENVQDRDADRANLKGKHHLRCLDLHWSWRPFNVEYSSNDGMVLDALQPNPELEILKIKNFMGFKPPQWMGDSLSSYLPKLEKLVLAECSQWQQLPALGKLPNLKVLSISGMSSVKSLGNELYGGVSGTGGKSPTRPLMECSQWEQLLAFEQLSYLEVLSVSGVSSVKRVGNKLHEGEGSTSEQQPTGLFPSLIELTLEYMENLESWDVPQSTLSPFPLLEKLTISFCNKLKVVRTPFPSLKELQLQSCQRLEDVPDIQCLQALQKFTVKDCKELKLSPDALKHIFSTALLDIDAPLHTF